MGGVVGPWEEHEHIHIVPSRAPLAERKQAPAIRKGGPIPKFRFVEPLASKQGCSVRESLRARIDLNRRGHAGNQANAIRDLIDLDADRHALSEADPGEYRVDVREPLLIGVCIRDVNGPRNAADVAANDLAIAHQFDLGGIAFADGGELRFLEIGVNPERIGIDNRDHALPDGRVVTHPHQQVRDPPVHRRTDLCALQIDLRLIALSGGLGDTRLGAHQLRFERLDLALRDREGRLCALQRRLILEKRRSRLLLPSVRFPPPSLRGPGIAPLAVAQRSAPPALAPSGPRSP